MIEDTRTPTPGGLLRVLVLAMACLIGFVWPSVYTLLGLAILPALVMEIALLFGSFRFPRRRPVVVYRMVAAGLALAGVLFEVYWLWSRQG